MIGVDHVHVLQIGGGSLIGQVHRMVQGQVPDGEGFKLGITGLDAPAVLMVELGQTGCHLAAARAGGSYNHQRTAGDDVVIASIALIADNQRDIGRIACDGIVQEHRHTQGFQTLFEGIGSGLTLILGDDHTAHIQSDGPEGIDQTQHFQIVGDAQVPPDLVLFQVTGIDGDDDLCLIPELEKHLHLAVGGKTGQYPGSMEIVKQLAAEFQIELAAELSDPLLDVFRLHFEVFFVVKSDFHCRSPPFPVLTCPAVRLVSAKRDACGRL